MPEAQPQANPQIEHYAIEVVRARNDYYRESYRKLLLGVLISIIASFLLIGIFLYQRHSFPEPVYFATNQDGSLKIMVPLNLPYADDKAVLDFVSETILSTFSYDFLNYRNTLQYVRTRFTPDGYQNFIDALTKSENLRTVLLKKFSVTVKFAGDPVILQQGVLPSTNTYAWRIQVPMDVYYVSSQEQKVQPVIATLVLTRVSSLLNEYRVAIASLVLTDRVTTP